MKQFIEKYLGKVEWLITALFFVIIPVVFYKKQLDPVLYTRYLALSIWIFILTTVLLYKAYKGKFVFYFSRIDKLFFASGVLFVIVNIISSFGAINHYEAVFKTFKEFSFFITLFYLYQMLRNETWGKDLIIKSVIVMTLLFFSFSNLIYGIYDSEISKDPSRKANTPL